MLPVSVLDEMIDRFRHRWETDSQYRAAVSGVVGLLVLIALCSCAGIVSTMTNKALASAGFSAGGGGSAQIGQGADGSTLQGADQFPTETVPPWTPGSIPNAAPVPASQTPPPTPTTPPTPTPLPTDTPCPTGCGGGGGGGGGPKGYTTATASPATWTRGSQASVVVFTSIPNQGVDILVGWPAGACPSATNGGLGMTDGSGYYTYSFPVPSCAGTGQTNVGVLSQFGSGATIHPIVN